MHWKRLAIESEEPPGSVGATSPATSRDAEYWKWDVLDVLGKPGCPACRQMQWGLERYFFWFINEHHNSDYNPVRIQRS
jgi:hypothetical protein